MQSPSNAPIHNGAARIILAVILLGVALYVLGSTPPQISQAQVQRIRPTPQPTLVPAAASSAIEDAFWKGYMGGRWSLPKSQSPKVALVDQAGNRAVIWVGFLDSTTDSLLQIPATPLPAWLSDTGEWLVAFPGETQYAVRLLELPDRLLPDSVRSEYMPSAGKQPQLAQNAGYYPWHGSMQVTQDRQNGTNCSTASHCIGGSDEWAWDFGNGTSGWPVYAARSGRIAWINTANATNSGCLTCDWTTANVIVIDFGNNYAGIYMHLAYQAPMQFSVGDNVMAGQLIGHADRTGRTGASHLHFAIQPWNSSWNGNPDPAIWYRHSAESLFQSESTGNPTYPNWFTSHVPDPASPTLLALAMDVNPADLIGASLGTSDSLGAAAFGSTLRGFPTQGNNFVILSTGLAASAALPNDSGSLSHQLDGLNNSQGNDLVQLTLNLRVPADKNCMNVDFAYLSEEFPEFVGSPFNDTFTAELGGTKLSIVNQEVVAPLNFAFDAAGHVVSVNTVSGVSGNTGTTYDGTTQLLRAKRAVPPGQIVTIVFSVQDLGDSVYDSAVFLDNFRWSSDSQCQAGSTANPPVVLVHGWQGKPGSPTRQCSEGIGRLEEPGVYNTFDNMAQWFKNLGYDVWIAHLDTGPAYTPPIETNAQCLNSQIASVRQQTGQKVILVGHSMGGLVSRACLSLNSCRDNVSALYTLGSPHSGINELYLLKLLGNQTTTALACIWQPAMCQFTTDGMLAFNLFNPNRDNVGYHFIGGNKTPFPTGWMLLPLDGPNDGMVGSYSAVGWMFPSKWSVIRGAAASRHWTNETHTAGVGHPTYFEASGGAESQAFRCMAWLLGKRPSADCAAAASLSPNMMEAEPTLSSITQDIKGYLASNQSVNHNLQVDTSGHSMFYLSWLTGTLTFSITQPNGQVITPDYANLHPELVAYQTNEGDSETAPFAAYAFTTTLSGLYTVTINAGDVGPSGTDYLAFAALESTRTFSVTANAASYQVGGTAIFTAALQNTSGGLAGANVQAYLVRSDGITDTLTFNDLGAGFYHAAYVVPDAPGYLYVAFTATGQDGTTAFTRQVDDLLTIAPHTAQLIHTYSAQPRNDNGDTLFDGLDFQIGINANTYDNYRLFADLEANGQAVAQATLDVAVFPGSQVATLEFDGNDIRRQHINGPYTIAHVYLVNTTLGIVAESANNVLTTSAYNWQDFGGCFHLTTGVNPSSGGTIEANPAPNCNNGTQYSFDTVVQLTAVPALGYSFANWIVDGSGEVSPISITVDSDKTVKANMNPPNLMYLPLVSRGAVAPPADTYEPNDTLAQAYGPLGSGVTYVSYLSSNNDVDYYYFDILTLGQMTVELSNIGAPSSDYELELYGTTGQFLAGSWGVTTTEQVVFQPVAIGRYYVEVYPATGANPTQPYYLKVQYNGAPGAGDIFGTIYATGAGQPNVPIQLNFYDYNTYAYRTVWGVTNSSGQYHFRGMDALGSNQVYYAYYGGDLGPSYSGYWYSADLTYYAAGSTVTAGNADISALDLGMPNSTTGIPLPVTFTWTPRTTSPTETYRVYLFDPSGYSTHYLTSDLGHVGSFALSGLPSGFTTGHTYRWLVYAYGADGSGSGSYYANKVVFSSSGVTVYSAPAPLDRRGCRLDSSKRASGSIAHSCDEGQRTAR